MSLTGEMQLRVYGEENLPTLIYLPGMHGDWTLIAALREALAGRVRFVEFAYPLRDLPLEEYGPAIGRALRERGIRRGWVLAESFGSQVAWGWLEWVRKGRQTGGESFEVEGIILAGGFVRYPLAWGIRLVRGRQRKMSPKSIGAVLGAYVRFQKWRHRGRPTVRASLEEFLANRAVPEDRRVILQRYGLILSNDPRALAANPGTPVYYLTGFWDIVVPWPFVLAWLKKHCATLRDWRLVWNAEHNVLCTQPEASARQILAWMGRG